MLVKFTKKNPLNMWWWLHSSPYLQIPLVRSFSRRERERARSSQVLLMPDILVFQLLTRHPLLRKTICAKGTGQKGKRLSLPAAAVSPEADVLRSSRPKNFGYGLTVREECYLLLPFPRIPLRWWWDQKDEVRCVKLSHFPKSLNEAYVRGKKFHLAKNIYICTGLALSWDLV